MPQATANTRANGHPSTVDDLEAIAALPDAAARRSRRTPRRDETTVAPGRYLGLYGKYVALFVGAGLISGAIVHYPLDKARYLVIGAIGAALFALASVLGDARPKTEGRASLLRFILASLVLALGIGMISGGIQHFSDIPARAATLIPLGALLSVVAFAIRDGHRLSPRHLVPFAVAGSAALLWLAIGLNAYAKGFDTSGAGHHGAEASGAAHHGAEEPAPAAGEATHTTDGHASERSASAAPADAAVTDAAADTAHAADSTDAGHAAHTPDEAATADDHSAHGH